MLEFEDSCQSNRPTLPLISWHTTIFNCMHNKIYSNDIHCSEITNPQPVHIYVYRTCYSSAAPILLMLTFVHVGPSDVGWSTTFRIWYTSTSTMQTADQMRISRAMTLLLAME